MFQKQYFELTEMGDTKAVMKGTAPPNNGAG